MVGSFTYGVGIVIEIIGANVACLFVGRVIAGGFTLIVPGSSLQLIYVHRFW
jgi:hypothetical protein